MVFVKPTCIRFRFRRNLQSRPEACKTQMRAMRFRPCVDLHSGRVKQIVGGTLKDDQKESPLVNFETSLPASYFATLYHRDRLPGGHVIQLGPGNRRAALEALRAFPGGMHLGGGVTPANASEFLDAGASHVIVTSYVFRDGRIEWDRVTEMRDAVGKERLVLDLSCRKRANSYYVCTDRWQKWTEFELCAKGLETLGKFCDEILVHAVDVEGRRCGTDLQLVEKLAQWASVPVTYAGGVRSIDDLNRVKDVGKGRVDVTVGSALSIFGGEFKYEDAVEWQRNQEAAAVT